MGVKRIRIVGWLLAALLLLPTAAVARAALLPAAAVTMSEQSTVCVDYFQPDRGSITDRYGRKFTDTLQPALLLFPAQLSAEDEQKLAALLGIGTEQLQEEMAGQSMLVLRRGLSYEQAAALSAAQLKAVHLLELPSRQTVAAGWLISLLELQYDEFLCGRGGGQVIANIDARGNYCGNGLFLLGGGAGNTLQLTLDLDYQQLAERALARQQGALLLADAASGEVRAFAASDAETALTAHDAAQLQPLLAQLETELGALHFSSRLSEGISAVEGDGLNLPQVLRLALLAASGTRTEPQLVCGICDEQGAWLHQPEKPLPEPPLFMPQTLLLPAATGDGSWYITQRQGLLAVLWLEGAEWQARQLTENLLNEIAALENWPKAE